MGEGARYMEYLLASGQRRKREGSEGRCLFSGYSLVVAVNVVKVKVGGEWEMR
jgi:hypothetical protein